jgi:hypothetical protein
VRISRQTVGVTGAVVLALGVFAPIVTMPLVGDIDYFRRGNGEGPAILLLAALAAGLALARKYRLILLPAGLSLGMIGYKFLDVRAKLHDARAALDSLGPLRPLGALAVDAIRLRWGWAAMLAGIALLFVAAFMPEQGDAGQAPAGPDAGEEPPVRSD